jgi:hypothetical protein
MSARSRRPDQQKTGPSPQLPDLSVVLDSSQGCDCPDCTESELDPEQMLADLVDGATALAEAEDPLEAEVTGAVFVAMACSGDADTHEAVAGALVPAIEARGTREALTLLTAIGAVAGETAPSVAEAAQAAAARLAEAGVAVPAWADDLAQPLLAGPFTRLIDDADTMSVLIGVLRRAGREHGLMIMVDHEDCRAADEIYLVDGEDLPMAVTTIRQAARQDGITITTSKLGAPEFRWYVEQALEARAVHDAEDASPADIDLILDGDGPGYAPLAVLTRSQLAGLPPARRPRDSAVSAHSSSRTALDVLQQFASQIGSPAPFGLDQIDRFRPQPAKLPAKRRKSDGPAPVYQIKVSLRGAKPPIWRRLLVPGDMKLNHLHQTILATFGWCGGHLHAFDTPYGEFGDPDPEFGHRADSSVVLEQVAPAVKDKIRYTYDFGDDWDHQILVEKVTPADPAVEYPVCTGGRRAAPPDDCGGIWGYQELIEILADPDHAEHAERLDWLGLDDASHFTPDAFDVDEVNLRLRAH